MRSSKPSVDSLVKNHVRSLYMPPSKPLRLFTDDVVEQAAADLDRVDGKAVQEEENVCENFPRFDELRTLKSATVLGLMHALHCAPELPIKD